MLLRGGSDTQLAGSQGDDGEKAHDEEQADGDDAGVTPGEWTGLSTWRVKRIRLLRT